jgi:hypothetical protein
MFFLSVTGLHIEIHGNLKDNLQCNVQSLIPQNDYSKSRVQGMCEGGGGERSVQMRVRSASRRVNSG